MEGVREVQIAQQEDIVEARSAGRQIAKEIGFRPLDCTQVVAAISELARNIVLYAQRGTVTLTVLRSAEGRVGLQIVAVDTGPGIEDVEAAMRDGYTTSCGLGLGLPGTKRLMDEFELHSQPGEGTKVRVVKWLAQ
jgi:serine/threonine-protein kinase RsbT